MIPVWTSWLVSVGVCVTSAVLVGWSSFKGGVGVAVFSLTGVDISSLLGGDILGKLRQRHVDAKSRFSKERDESKALRERERCLKKLKEELDIPDSVLKSLPTADMIEAKTKEMMDKDNSWQKNRN